MKKNAHALASTVDTLTFRQTYSEVIYRSPDE